MKLESGKRYKLRNGEVVGPLICDPGKIEFMFPYTFLGDDGLAFYSWTADGRWTAVGQDHPKDIIEEVETETDPIVFNAEIGWYQICRKIEAAPVLDETMVEVELVDGARLTGPAARFSWSLNIGDPGRIVRFRVLDDARLEPLPEYCVDMSGEPLDDLGKTKARETDVKAQIADEAKRIVSGARRSTYGSPENNFDRIARLWNGHLVNCGVLDAGVMGDPEAKGGITAGDVALMMDLMKTARLAESPDHYDSVVDKVGYTLTYAEVAGIKPKD